MTVTAIGVSTGIAPVLVGANGQQVITEFATAGEGVQGVVVRSPNAQTIFAEGFEPGTGGTALLLVLDITPAATGLITILAQFPIASSNSGSIQSIAAFAVPALTAVTGGTAIATGVTATPTSTTPAFTDPSAIELIAQAQPSFINGEVNDTVLNFAFTFQGTEGTRYGFVFVATDSDSENAWTCAGQASAVETSLAA